MKLRKLEAIRVKEALGVRVREEQLSGRDESCKVSRNVCCVNVRWSRAGQKGMQAGWTYT